MYLHELRGWQPLNSIPGQCMAVGQSKWAGALALVYAVCLLCHWHTVAVCGLWCYISVMPLHLTVKEPLVCGWLCNLNAVWLLSNTCNQDLKADHENANFSWTIKRDWKNVQSMTNLYINIQKRHNA